MTHQIIGGIGSIAWASCGIRDEDTADQFTGWISGVDCEDCLGDVNDWANFIEALKKSKA